MPEHPEPQQPDAALPAAQVGQAAAASSLGEAPNAREADRTVVGTVLEVEREFIWIETEGTRAKLYASELMLDIGEVPADRYTPGDRFEAFVFQMEPDPESGAPQFSIRRAAPYPDALNRLEVGSVVANATVVNTYGVGIELDVDGVRGNAFSSELPLHPGESTHQRYQPGDITSDLLVCWIDNDRGLFLSARRNAPGYVEALNARSVGDIVSGVVTELDDDGELTLDIDGVIGYVALDELVLNDGEALGDRYAVGDVVEDLLVWVVDHDARDLALSVRRNAPGYVEALSAHSVGDVVSAPITIIQDNGGLWLDVGSVIGRVTPDELTLAEGESATDRYSVDDTVDDLFVWQINDSRSLSLSLRRNAPGYVEALNTHHVGDVVSATVINFQGNGGLILDVGDVLGGAPPWDLALADGESAQDRYAVGDPIHNLFVWQVGRDDRTLALSVRRNAPGYVEALNTHRVGDVVSGTITSIQPGGLWLDIDGAIGWIFKEEVLLENDETLAERYADEDPVTAVVQHVDRQSRALLLSARRIASALVEEPIVQGATIKAIVVRKRAGGIDVSLGGGSEIYVPDYALSLRPGGSPDLEPGQEIEVVVMDVKDGVPTVLSRRRALDGWEAARGRLAVGVVAPNAQIIPWADRPNDDGRAAIDLGPITGFIPIDELDAEAAQNLMSRRANTRLGIVIEDLNEGVWTASVSGTNFKARWDQLVDGLPTNEGIEGEIIDIARGVATLDLGCGLLGEMPVNELPPLANEGGERVGEVVTVGIRAVDPDEYRIAVESGAYRLAEMIADRENITCEFKAVFKGRRGNEEVRSGYPVARAMAGMMNRGGGHVLVGVYEDQETKKGVVIGWEESGFKTEDGFVNELSNVVGRMLTTAAGDFYDVRFETLPSGERIVDIVCRRADRPIFTKKTWTRGSLAEFFVRYDAATRRPADDREMYDYIRERF